MVLTQEDEVREQDVRSSDQVPLEEPVDLYSQVVRWLEEEGSG